MQRIVGYLSSREAWLHRAGDAVPFHAHPFPHHTHILLGRARATLRTAQKEIVAVQELVPGPTAGSVIVVPAGVEHELVALEDGTYYACMHPNLKPLPDDGGLGLFPYATFWYPLPG